MNNTLHIVNKNRIFLCKRTGKEVRVTVDPTGVVLSPLHLDNIKIEKSNEIKNK